MERYKILLNRRKVDSAHFLGVAHEKAKSIMAREQRREDLKSRPRVQVIDHLGQVIYDL